jgi:toxin-antitoxin system PIN domain toxin
MESSLFPDVNVWLALTHSRHVHHKTAAQWFDSTSDSSIFFCRFTQLGLLRLLTNAQVMGADVMTQRSAWHAYRRWFEDGRIEFHREPESAAFEELIEQLSVKPQPSPKLWSDAYLAAFGRAAGLVIVTFDRGFPSAGSASVTVL